MNGGPLPPVPDLIPIAALRKDPTKRQNKSEKVRQQSCAPNSTRGEVMGEQRSRRTGKQPAVDLIDSVQSRGASAAPQARKARSERHRKSDRRREHKGGRKRSSSKHRSRSSKRSSPERHPRVNPIFVWVRQEDTHIVDVKCEDYDKRNRILLTKTAQGWRAIPRTETLVPSLKEADDENRHRIRKARKSCKVKRKSTAVQVDGDMTDEIIDITKDSPSWMTPVNIESHLPSHTIHIPKRRCMSEDRSLEAEDVSSVNSDVNCSAQTQDVKCSASKSCDVTSPLDNLLAVAELEFNNQIQNDEWDKASVTEVTEANVECVTEESKEYLDSMTQLNKFIDNCSSDNREEDIRNLHSDFDDQKIEECDYNEEEENNTVMDDILSRLEQSLRSPGEYHEQSEEVAECNSSEEVVSKENQIKEDDVDTSEKNIEKDVHETVPESNSYFEQKEAEPEKEQYSTTNFEEPDVLVGSSTNIDSNEDVPTDLSVSKSRTDSYSADTNCDDMVPTDLSIPKNTKPLAPLRPLTTPSPSQNSETIQSPQPSGIPAVPPSPDIFHSNNNNKSKSIFLESLLTAANQKVALNSEVTVTRQKEPLDLGKCRKSASPTVTCSEEVKNSTTLGDLEPLAKKFKIEDITLKTLLDPELLKTIRNEEAKSKNNPAPETPRLLELLTSDAEIDALTQLKQVLADTSLKVPDPMLVPKDRLSLILSSPAKEIPILLKQRPELRLPEALAYPHLLQDPDILVITLSQLQTIIQKQCQPIPIKNIKNAERNEDKSNENKETAKRDSSKSVNSNSHSKLKMNEEERVKSVEHNKKDGQPRASINELANDIDAATNAAFNQMMWLPYLNQLEAAAATFGNSPDFMKMLSNMFPMYSGQAPDMSHLFNTRIPPSLGFPLQPPVNYNPLEYSMWQEAIMQANMLRPKNPFEAFGQKNNYRECLDRAKMVGVSKKQNVSQKLPQMPDKFNPMQNAFYMPNMHSPQSMQNSFSNLPGAYTQHGNAGGQNVQIPPYNPLLNHQNSIQERKASNQQPYTSKNQYPKFDQVQMNKLLASSHLYSQHRSQGQQQQQINFKPDAASHRAKIQNKSVSMGNHHRSAHNKDVTRKYEESSKQSTQPIDLSGSTSSCGGKLKVRQHLIDQVNTPKLLKHDDAPEVGSTTASIEEMQESQKHLWHPLFGK